MEKTTSYGLPSASPEDAKLGQQRTEEGEYLRASSPLTWWASAAFAAIIGFSRLSYGLLLPSLQADLHGSFSEYGLVGAANFLGYLIGTLAVPVILTRYHNRVRLNTLALLLMNLFLVASAFSFDLAQLGIWRFLIGLFSAPATVLTLALALEHVQPGQRGLSSALVWMGVSFGLLASGLIAPFIASVGSLLAWRLVWVAMGLIGLLATYGFHRLQPERASRPARGGPQPGTDLTKAGRHELLLTLEELFHPRGLLFLTLAYFAVGFGFIIYLTFFIALVIHQGVSPLQAGLIWSIIGVTGIAGSPIWGRFMDHWPTGGILTVNLALGAIGTLTTLTSQPGIEFFGAILFGISAGAAAPAIVTFLLRLAVSDARYAYSFSFLTMLFAIGQSIGPVLGGIAVDRVGLPIGTASSALILGLATLCAVLYSVIQTREQPVVQQS